MRRLLMNLSAAILAIGTCANAQQAPPSDGSNPLNNFFHSLQLGRPVVRQGPAQRGARARSQVLDNLGLRDILPAFDPDKSNGLQFPHVAITVLQSPPYWLEPTSTFRGCWTLQAVVWSNAKTSKTVGPFDWCLPQDKEIELGPTGTLPMLGIEDKNDYATGVSRTEGPRPPSMILPDDRKMHDMEMAASKYGRTLPIQALYSMTAFGDMVANLRYQLGAEPAAEDHDFRVWIVGIMQ